MSFNATDKSGEVVPLPVTDFLQFIPSIGAAISLGFTSFLQPIISGVSKAAVKTPSISTNIFSKTNPIFSKTNVIAGSGLGITALGTSFLQTPQGQNTVNTVGNITDVITKNPIIPIALIGLGFLIVIGVMKK